MPKDLEEGKKEDQKISDSLFKEVLEFLGLELVLEGKSNLWLKVVRGGTIYKVYLDDIGFGGNFLSLDSMKKSFFRQERLCAIEEFYIDPKNGFTGDLRSFYLDNPFANLSSYEEVRMKLDLMQKA